AVYALVVNFVALITHDVFGTDAQKLKIIFNDVLDSHEYILESGLPHKCTKNLAMVRDRRCHTLNHVLDVIETGGNDRFAQLFKTMNVQRDVVVDQKDGLRPMLSSL